jgi:putative transposase
MREGYSPRLPPSAEDLLILLGRVAYRTVQHYGIDFLNLRYNSPDLALLRNRLNGEQAKIKYHPGDLSKLYVHDPFDDVYIVVPTLAGDYTDGLSLWKHRIICAYARRHQDRVDLAALGRAKRKIQEVVDMAMSRRRRRGGRKLGRWNNSGKPPSLGDRSASAAPPGSAAWAPPAEPSLALPSPDHDDSGLAVEPSEEEGWGISYNLPRSGAPPVTTQEAVTDDTE